MLRRRLGFGSLLQDLGASPEAWQYCKLLCARYLRHSLLTAMCSNLTGCREMSGVLAVLTSCRRGPIPFVVCSGSTPRGRMAELAAAPPRAAMNDPVLEYL